MSFRQSVLGEIAIRDGHRLAGVNLGALVRRLILFDRVVIKSYRYRELPLLVRTFGKAGFRDLLGAGVLKLCCEFTAIVTDVHRNGQRSIPRHHFNFGIVDAHDREGTLRNEFGHLQTVPGLKNAERTAIEEAVWSATLRPPSDFGQRLLSQIDSDIRAGSELLKSAVEQQLRGKPSSGPLPSLNISVAEPTERVFRVDTNVSEIARISQEEAHQLMQRSVTGVVNLDHRLAEMEAYTSLTGFLNEEAPLLFGRIAGIIGQMNPEQFEKQFTRIIKLADVPDFVPGQKIDVKKLLEIRQSSECRDFKDWLHTAHELSDSEIGKLVNGVRAKLGNFAGTTAGKTTRLVATTLISLIPGAGIALGPAAGAVDSFLVDKVLPHSGVFAFLAHQYPSVFSEP